MSKRNRTKSRFDEFYTLAVAVHQQNWDRQKTDSELALLIGKNYDLAQAKSIATAKDEFWVMADPKLRGWLPKLYDLARERMEKEPAGTPLRLNHEMVKFCRRVGKASDQASTVREIELEITG